MRRSERRLRGRWHLCHRAYYDLEVKRIDGNADISTIRGRLAYEITGSTCDGFSVNYRLANRVQYKEGTARVIDTQLTSYESGDGLQLDMTQKQFVDAEMKEETRIKVNKDAEGTTGKGLLTKTDTKTFETVAAALFPTRYQVKLVEAAEQGKSYDEQVIYDGSNEDKSLKAVSFIGPKKPMSGVPEEQAKALGSMDSWPVTVSYFPLDDKADGNPVYTASFNMLDNGISTDLVLDYGSYALTGKLTKLEMLKPETCP
ncbi:MAG: DUF1849 family protein [Hyphomicrobiales bacterium]